MEKVPFDNDFEQILISAVRYACGRATYIVSFTINYISQYLKDISDWCLEIMIRDISTKLSDAERLGRTAGMQQDHNNWLRFKAVLTEEQERRKAAQNDRQIE